MAALLSPTAAEADDDPWWGRDKALHFGVSTGLAASVYGTAALLGASRAGSAAVAASATLGLGIGKEVADALGLGQASFRDLAWDVAGTALGLGIALGVDGLVRKTPEKKAVVLETAAGPRTFSLRLTFAL